MTSAVPTNRRASGIAKLARLTIAPLFVAIGVVHLARPQYFVPFMPAVAPAPETLIALTGVAEIAGAAGLFVRRTQALAAVMLALYAVCVFPVNINHAVHDLSAGVGAGWAYHYPRLFLQPLICAWALMAGGVLQVRFTFGSSRNETSSAPQ